MCRGGHSLSSGAVVEELGQAPAAEVGEDEECRPRSATRLNSNPNWQINHLFQVCLGQRARGRGWGGRHPDL